MKLIKKIIFKIYNAQLKSVDKKQKDLIWDKEVTIDENLPYKNSQDPLDTYDYIYLDKTSPLIINIHGGAFAGGDKKVNKYYAAYLAKNNYAVATINYHYLPEANLKRQVQDCLKALEEIIKKYKKEEIFLTGDSSGSDLVLLIALLFTNKEMQKAYEVNIPKIKIKALGLTSTQASIDMFPPSMKRFNEENKKMLLNQCEEIKEYTDIKKLWTKDMPPIHVISAEGDVNYSNCKEFDQWLTKIKHPHKSYYCTKEKDKKLYHCFNVIRPDLECSKKANQAMLRYFKELD